MRISKSVLFRTTQNLIRIALLEDKIYTVGGCTLNEKRPLTTMNVYDPVTDRSAGAEMNIKRMTLGVASLDNAIYAIAGMSSDRTTYNLCEVFDPKTQVECNKTNAHNLHQAGGYSESENADVFNVLRYDYKTGEWNRADSLKYPRHNAGAGVLNGTLYVVGGKNYAGILKSVEAFNPQTKRWQQVKNMPEGREHVAVVGFGKHLYVVGGNDGEKYFTSVNVYCPKSDTWEVLSSSMSIERGSTAVAIINKPHNYI